MNTKAFFSFFLSFFFTKARPFGLEPIPTPPLRLKSIQLGVAEYAPPANPNPRAFCFTGPPIVPDYGSVGPPVKPRLPSDLGLDTALGDMTSEVVSDSAICVINGRMYTRGPWPVS